MVETRPGLLAEFMLLSFLLWQFGFRHGSSDTTTELDPKPSNDLCCSSLTGAALTGFIPKEVGKLKHLETLDLSGNQLTGSIPDTLWNLSSLKELSLYYNNLSDLIPCQLGNITALQTLSAASNDLTGEFSDFSNLTQMRILSIFGNNFAGSIPAEVFNFSSLQYLKISDVANSGFQLPRSANLSNIETLILRNCSITGEIPEYIGKMSNLKYLDLSFNNLTGRIPKSMSGLNLIQYLSLAKNELNDTIPAWVGAVKSTLDLSYNNFSEVSLPDDKRDNLNLFACCSSSSSTDPDQLFLKTGSHSVRIHKKTIVKLVADHSLFINCGGEGLTVGDKYYEAHNSTSLYYISPSKTWGYSLSGQFLSPESNSSNFIQTQSCGIRVPESDLYLNARIAPVFLSYYACLHKGRYNVTLHSAEIVFREKESYSILKRGAFDVNDSVLEISFYGAGKGRSKSRLKFNWENRFNICLGIARGLDHLHEHPRLKMVHRDIKAENILLDGALNAKISDFGMASLYTEEEQLMIIKVWKHQSNWHQSNVAMAHGECTKADSSTSTDVSARASTSTKLIKGIEETEIHYAEPDLEILEETQTSFSG
ncbi:PREDICTED: probable [Prunus dulcis]|uniref:non-specific serine/threonine protein kinase n=1 Tax=Prunus dulcis TaxID=3755 RepID=A0A5E4G8Z8_PRUDU|nr:PREDICTED: probable [Prunus dulcis]